MFYVTVLGISTLTAGTWVHKSDTVFVVLPHFRKFYAGDFIRKKCLTFQFWSPRGVLICRNQKTFRYHPFNGLVLACGNFTARGGGRGPRGEGGVVVHLNWMLWPMIVFDQKLYFPFFCRHYCLQPSFIICEKSKLDNLFWQFTSFEETNYDVVI